MSQPNSPIQGSTALPTVTIVSQARALKMYSLTEDELDNLYSSGNYKTLDVAMLSFCASAFLTLVITMSTVEIAKVAVWSAFISASVVCLLGTIFFGARAVITWKSASRKLKEIKGQT